MTYKSSEIRKKFFNFFESKGHKIVPSAPIVVKDDPTLMFTNAGMNQFKDLFLGNKKPDFRRIANTQKCLRVSGKHNDLEEVGRDSYHHTMFEMLGNWSIGDYFKEEAIDWAWELLINEYGLDPDRLYATVFGGDEKENLDKDIEAAKLWEKYLPKDRILYFSKKDNFWEMGDMGPCGPCSELHYDLRTEDERSELPGQKLVNAGDPRLVEIWNLVFIQYNRKADGSLEELPEKHVDTGMGFERLCMALQGKKSNYDTDIFNQFIKNISTDTGITYTNKYDDSSKSDIAMRVIADHIRAVSFAIADGELPSNTGAGYVIRRILRRAIRYYYSFLGQKEPFIYRYVGVLAEQFENVFPELRLQQDFVVKVILEEEKSFLRTLEGGLKRIESLQTVDNVLDGRVIFELYDTYGFPIDLTRLIAEEKNWQLDEVGFTKALNEQKERSRQDAQKIESDWSEIHKADSIEFLGYDQLSLEGAKVVKFRTVTSKGVVNYQLVTDKTVFYAEGGGQVGDKGWIKIGDDKIKVLNTHKENDLIIHTTDKLPSSPGASISMNVDDKRRQKIENNHTATHLLHAALRMVLGTHVQQKGSLVESDHLRFDFAHFQKMTDEEIRKVEEIVNEKIRENIPLKEDRSVPIELAKKAGAMMLFGEKYGDHVRMITFDPSYSTELCGGCHVKSTGRIGLFKITSESAIAAGVRRIEAYTGEEALQYLNKELELLNNLRQVLKNPKDLIKTVVDIQEENKSLRKDVEALKLKQTSGLQSELLKSAYALNGMNVIKAELKDTDAKTAKTLMYNLLKSMNNGIVMLGIKEESKAQLMLAIDEQLTKTTGIHAGKIVQQLAVHIEGGGGGQAFFASAGGKKPEGLASALTDLDKFLS